MVTMSNQQQLPKESVSLNNKKYNINAPFAPGTYIELEITPPQSNIMQWSFIEINSQKALQNLLNETTNIHSLTIHSLLDKNQISNKQYNVQILTDDNNVIDTNKLGFSLPITRDNEETFDKYYIIVFVYDANKQKPTLQDAYIIIDMSFRVGIGGDNAVGNK